VPFSFEVNICPNKDVLMQEDTRTLLSLPLKRIESGLMEAKERDFLSNRERSSRYKILHVYIFLPCMSARYVIHSIFFF